MNKKYKHILLSNDSSQRLELEQAPIGWDSSKFNILRDLVYFGIMKTISVEYEFVGDGYLFLQSHRLRFGMDANIILRVYKKNKFLFEGKINFENYIEDRRDRKFKVDIIQSSFVQKFKNREDVKLNIRNNISLDRRAVTPAEYKSALFRGKRINFISEFDGVSTDTPSRYHHVVPLLLKSNGNPGVSGPNGIQIDNNFVSPYTDPSTYPYAPQDLSIPDAAFYRNVLTEEQTITVIFDIDFTSVNLGSPPPVNTGGDTFFYQGTRIIIRVYDVDRNIIEIPFVYRSEIVFGNFQIADSITFNVPAGGYAIMNNEQIQRVNNGGVDTFIDFLQPFSVMEGILNTEYTYNSATMTITQDSVVTDTTHPVILPHELFTNLVQQINGGNFISNFFGRTDLGYYEDGDGAYVGITKGELLRGIDQEEVQISTSFREAFSSYSSIFCLGAIITTNGIQIEPLEDLLNNSVAADIGEISKLQIKPAKDYLFNSIKAGYPVNEYEQENGRDEFNTLYQYTNSFQAVKRELDISSKYNGDGYGIEFARRASVLTTGSQDSRYDDKIFLISLFLDGSTLKTKQLEGILHVDGIFSPETAMNLEIAAGQNILRWKKFLNIPLHRKSDRKIYFQTKDKNASLELVTNLGTTNDGQDIDLGNTAYFLPEERVGQCPITLDNLFSILANPLGRIKYTYEGEKFYDFLFEADSETEKVVTQWRFLGTKDTPVQVEEEFETGAFIKYGDGANDFLRYSDLGSNILYN